MKTKITIKQANQFNRMLYALKAISKYESPERIAKVSEKRYGLEYDEALEMAYENVLIEAKAAIKGVKYFAINEPVKTEMADPF
jgi:hypothetical protein